MDCIFGIMISLAKVKSFGNCKSDVHEKNVPSKKLYDGGFIVITFLKIGDISFSDVHKVKVSWKKYWSDTVSIVVLGKIREFPILIKDLQFWNVWYIKNRPYVTKFVGSIKLLFKFSRVEREKVSHKK